MSVSIKGIPELQTRLSRLKPSPELMRELGLSAIREQKQLVPRKTGNLGRSIGLGSITPTAVVTRATAAYAAFVEFGTKAHTIVPRVRKALRFAPGGSGRLSGAPRSGGPVVFARRVRHPGTKPHPFMVPGARAAVAGIGLKDTIVRLWNGR